MTIFLVSGIKAKYSGRKMNIEQIADRANELSLSMGHGYACFTACREAGVPESEVSFTASIVSMAITQREINRPETDAQAAARIARAKEDQKEARENAVRHAAQTRASFEFPGGDNRDARATRVSELLNTPAWVEAQVKRYNYDWNVGE